MTTATTTQPEADRPTAGPSTIPTADPSTIRVTQIRDIPGGIQPPQNKAQSLSSPIGEAPLPSRAVLPLKMHIGAPARPVVSVGDRVLTGQMIAMPQGLISTAIHASISGTVVGIEDRPLPHPSGMSGPAIVIESDSQDEWVELKPMGDYRSVEPGILIASLRNSGLAGLGGAGFPTAVKLKPQHPVNTLILNGAECEPYITSDQAMMRERAEDVVQGALLLAYILGEPGQILIGIEDNKPDAVLNIRRAAGQSGDPRIQVIDFPCKYPSGGEKQLIQILTGREVASGRLPSDMGIVLQNVGSAVAALEAIALGRPLVSRVTTLVGEALDKQRNLQVRIGTPIQELLDYSGFDPDRAARVIMGGPLMGFSILNTQAPATKITNCLLSPTKKELPPAPPAQACIRCGHCAEACPVSLLPQQLFWYAQSEDEDKLKDHNLFDCIECGACAYVCPSNIPLVQYYRAAKGTIRAAEREKVKSDRARLRFEARQERLEREAVERAARRKARMEAANSGSRPDAKDGSSAGDQSAAGLIAQAMARVNEAKARPEDARARLERQKQTLEERITGIRDKIKTADTDELTARFAAQLKNTEKKLRTTRKKLEELEDSTDTAPPRDAASAAIARAQRQAQAMASMSDREKLQAKLDSLRQRKETSAQKLAAAERSAADTVDALRNGLDKINEKISAAENGLRALADTEKGAPDASTD